jgi:hypothetical protein
VWLQRHHIFQRVFCRHGRYVHDVSLCLNQLVHTSRCILLLTGILHWTEGICPIDNPPCIQLD